MSPTALVPLLLTAGGLGPGDTFVDLGCGSGEVVLAAAAHPRVRAGKEGVRVPARCSPRMRQRGRLLMGGERFPFPFELACVCPAAYSCCGVFVVVVYTRRVHAAFAHATSHHRRDIIVCLPAPLCVPRPPPQWA